LWKWGKGWRGAVYLEFSSRETRTKKLLKKKQGKGDLRRVERGPPKKKNLRERRVGRKEDKGE